VIVFLGILFLLVSFILETLALGELRRILYDFGLSFIELTGFAIILFLGGGLIAREIEGRTIFLMLSKPVSRLSIFFGKFLGFATVVLAMVVFQSILLVCFILWKGFAIDPLIFLALFGILLKLFSVLALILFFSAFTSPLVAMFLTVCSYMIGHGGYAMLDMAIWDGNALIGTMGKVVLVVFPNLEALNLKNYVATGAPVDIPVWLMGYGIGIFYITVITVLGALIFSKKSFDNA
jgi:ABC-type transport system involved in multi-copper enzyme maturation permease subunit